MICSDVVPWMSCEGTEAKCDDGTAVPSDLIPLLGLLKGEDNSTFPIQPSEPCYRLHRQS